MSASTTMTIRLSREVKDKLGQLAQDTRRTRSFLAGEAVAAYVDRELAILNGVAEGLADLAAGKTVSHEAAMAELQGALGEIASKAR